MSERKNNQIFSLNVKFLLKFLAPSTANEYTLVDSFHFAEEISQQDPNLHIAGLDVDSLFTNIPLDETIDICIDNLYNCNENRPNIAKHDFRNLLNIDTKESFFTFKPVFYRRYLDDIFALFSSPDHADKFKEYLSSKQPSTNFSIEKEEDGCLPFSDVNIFREKEICN